MHFSTKCVAYIMPSFIRRRQKNSWRCSRCDFDESMFFQRRRTLIQEALYPVSVIIQVTWLPSPRSEASGGYRAPSL